MSSQDKKICLEKTLKSMTITVQKLKIKEILTTGYRLVDMDILNNTIKNSL